MKNKRLLWLVMGFALLDWVVVRVAHRTYELKAIGHKYVIAKNKKA